METRIRTFDDLEKEKLRLQAALHFHAGLIRNDVEKIREELKPFKVMLDFLAKLSSFTRQNPLLAAGVNIAEGIVLNKLPVVRSGLLDAVVFPFLVKNVSALLFSKSGEVRLRRITEKVHALTERFRKGNANGRTV